MKTVNFSITLILITILSFFSSCSKNETTTTLSDSTITIETIKDADQRSKGRITTNVEEDQTAFMVFYTGNLDDILMDDKSQLREIIETMDFNLDNPVSIDESIQGILLTTFNVIEDPVALGKEISLCKEVMMVQVKNAREELAS